jgi:two-component system phosphate regulon sensor histidine kinase PhoR
LAKAHSYNGALPRVRASLRSWIEPPRHLLLPLAAVTVASAGAFGWLGWEMLRRDDAVEAQRAQERLEHQADLTVQAIERLLVATEEPLAAWVSRPSLPVPEAADGGLVVAFTPTGIQTGGSAPLLFHPYVPQPEEPPSTLFTEGEAAEFQQRDLRQAAAIFGRLAQSTDPAVRAAALLRLGRVLRASGQHQDALAAYTRMAALGDVRVANLPADLLARSARLHVLAAMGGRGEASSETRTLLDDLARARWPLTRGQYEFYRDAATAIAGDEAAASQVDVATAQAVDILWNEWRAGLSPAGRRAVRVSDAPLLVTWRAADDRAVAWVLPPDQVLRQASRDTGLAIALSDHDGSRVAGVLEGSGREAIRMPADSRLPWVVHVRRAAGHVPESRFTRGRLTVLGIVVMSLFLVTGVYFIGRAVRREMELARLQADFVSAVSHEFRTPLAAMRQLSEVLAAGRVPDQARQIQYFEALSSESRRLQRLVENLLDFGRLQAGGAVYRFQPVEPRALVERVVTEFRGQVSPASCHVDVVGTDECGRVLADPDAVGLALYNLLDNAVKYGGTEPHVDVSWEREGSRIGLRVRDNGPGVPPEERARIFERFVRGSAAASASVRGTGIGLALVKQIATGHGGDVAVEPAPGTGSVFTIWLPVAGDSHA